MIKIRQTNDIGSVLYLNELIFGVELNVKKNTNHWIATDSETGEPVGFCSVSDFGHGILFLSRAGLLRKYRGRNIHRRLIRVRERFAKSRGFKKIITYTSKDNYESMANLIKYGFKLYTPEWKYVGDNFTYFIKSV